MTETLTCSIRKFKEAFQRGIDGIVTASEIYVASIDADPRAADAYREQCGDWIPPSAWSSFEAVGRKYMHPRLLIGGIPDRRKSTIIKRLPYSTQERIFARETFDLLVADGDTIKVSPLEAEVEQVEQLFDGGHARTLPEQKAYIESRKILREEPCETLPYSVSNGKLVVRRPVTLTRADLKHILQEM